MTGCLIAIAVSVVLVIGAAVLLIVVAGTEIDRRFGDADVDSYALSVEDCGSVEGRLVPHIVGAITNTDDISRGFRLDVYVIEQVEGSDSADRVGERDIFVDPLRPGETAQLVHPIAIGDADPDSVRCEVEVSYWGVDE